MTGLTGRAQPAIGPARNPFWEVELNLAFLTTLLETGHGAIQSR